VSAPRRRGSNETTREAIASDTKARAGFDVKTMSAGSSPTSIVRVTRIVARSTTLTESEI
jgi:hypothetical protein